MVEEEEDDEDDTLGNSGISSELNTSFWITIKQEFYSSTLHIYAHTYRSVNLESKIPISPILQETNEILHNLFP